MPGTGRIGDADGRRSFGTRFAEHLRSNVVGYVALFVALSGAAIALPGKNSVDSGDIKKKTVRTSDLAPNAVKGTRLAPGAVSSGSVADDSLSGVDLAPLTGTDLAADSVGGNAIDEGTLGQVPSAASATNAANAEIAANAGQLGGVGPAGYLRWGGTIPSGVTVRGAFVSADNDDIRPLARSGASFPLPAPADLTDSQVNFSPSSVGGDDDPACAGNAGTPTAPAGKVCIYHDGSGNFQDAAATGVSIGGGGSASRFGFAIEGPSIPPGPVDETYIRGTWAYTAP